MGTMYRNIHIYRTLFKTQERESDIRSKEIAKKGIVKKHTNKTTRTCTCMCYYTLCRVVAGLYAPGGREGVLTPITLQTV